MILCWAAAAVVFAMIELATVGLSSIWFVLGSLCALAAAAFRAKLWLQILLFAAVSLLSLLLTRPLVRKYINGRTLATNADRVLGCTGVVRERIEPLSGTGAVFADGKLWSAVCADGGTAEVGETVTVREIRGVKLVVELQNNRQEE